MHVEGLPDHDFVSAYYNIDPTSPDAICLAMLTTATRVTHGFSMQTQCGHTLAEHTE